MRRLDPVLLSVIADFAINFSVFWFGVAIVNPIFPGIDPSLSVQLLTEDIFAGIFSLLVGYFIRRLL